MSRSILFFLTLIATVAISTSAWAQTPDLDLTTIELKLSRGFDGKRAVLARALQGAVRKPTKCNVSGFEILLGPGVDGDKVIQIPADPNSRPVAFYVAALCSDDCVASVSGDTVSVTVKSSASMPATPPPGNPPQGGSQATGPATRATGGQPSQPPQGSLQVNPVHGPSPDAGKPWAGVQDPATPARAIQFGTGGQPQVPQGGARIIIPNNPGGAQPQAEATKLAELNELHGTKLPAAEAAKIAAMQTEIDAMGELISELGRTAGNYEKRARFWAADQAREEQLNLMLEEQEKQEILRRTRLGVNIDPANIN